MTDKAVAVRETGQVVNFEDYAMPVDSIVRQVNRIQEVMQKVMKDGEHYGRIPGTDKPSLLKPGAEKLTLTFRLDPDYEIIREVRDRDFIAYTMKCLLTHIPTGQRIASGIGSCNSREAKYRFRFAEELTEMPVPTEYWKAKEAGDSKEMKRLLGEGMRVRKNEATGAWVLARAEKVENDNPWDLDNTIIKMACKRALVAAVLNGTAASDIFTQDVEDQDVEPEARERHTGKSGGERKQPAGRRKGGGTKAVKCPETGKFRPETECADCIVKDCKVRPRKEEAGNSQEAQGKDNTRGADEKARETAPGGPEGTFVCPDTNKMITRGKCQDCSKREGCPVWE